MMDPVKMGNTISEARKKQNLTQNQLAIKLNISDKAISKWERGLCCPDISLLIPLSKMLNISLYEILSGEKEEVEETLKNTINYSNNQIQKNKKKFKNRSLIIISILFIISSAFFYKIFYLFYYNMDFIPTYQYEKLVEGYQKEDTIYVQNKKINENEYLEYKNIKVKNIIGDFTYLGEEDGFIKYVLYDDNNNFISYFSIGISGSYVNLIKQNNLLFGINDQLFNDINKIQLLDKNNIKTDLDLYEFIVENKNIKNTIFMSREKMLENYYIKALSNRILMNIDSLTYIKGDICGYMLNINSNNIKIIHILENNKDYIISLTGLQYFDEDKISELLSTIVID